MRLVEADVLDGKCELRIAGLTPGPHTFIAHGFNVEGVGELSRPATILVQAPARDSVR